MLKIRAYFLIRWMGALTLCFSALPALALEGYDTFNNTRITVVAGDKIAVDEDLGIYIWREQRFAAVEIESLTPRGNDIELNVTDKKTNKYYYFEIASDDPGIDLLPHFDPGLPFPEVLPPGAHIGHDLLGARGNMMDTGNMIEQGDIIHGPSQLPQGNMIEQNTMPSNEHIIDRGLEPVE